MKILYCWLLLLDQFRFCETHFTTYQRFVADQNAISSSLGGIVVQHCSRTLLTRCLSLKTMRGRGEKQKIRYDSSALLALTSDLLVFAPMKHPRKTNDVEKYILKKNATTSNTYTYMYIYVYIYIYIYIYIYTCTYI